MQSCVLATCAVLAAMALASQAMPMDQAHSYEQLLLEQLHEADGSPLEPANTLDILQKLSDHYQTFAEDFEDETEGANDRDLIHKLANLGATRCDKKFFGALSLLAGAFVESPNLEHFVDSVKQESWARCKNSVGVADLANYASDKEVARVLLDG